MKNDSGMTERILALIRANRMTAREFTVRMGISSTSVSEWKRGRTQPSVEHVRRMSELFDVSTDYIITGREFRERLSEKTQADKIDAAAMGAAFAELTGEHREIVADFMLRCLENIKKYGDAAEPAPAAFNAGLPANADDTAQNITDTKKAILDFKRRKANGEFDD